MATSGGSAARPAWAPPALDEERLDAALRQLEWTVRVRLDGLLQGNHLGLVPGPGTEPGQTRAYEPGDDVRRMDWAVTARTGEPHVRQTIADRELETWVALDLSPSLDFGSAACDKRELAVAAMAAISHLTSGDGNRLGLIADSGAGQVRAPARTGRQHVRAVLRRAATMLPAPEGTRGDVRQLMESVRRRARRRGLVVVISDFLGETDWQRVLRGMGQRHSLLAIEVLDPRDVELPEIGTVTLADPESGAWREVDTTPRLCREYATTAAAHRDEVATGLRRAGCARLTLRTDSDWIADVVRFVVARKRRWSGGAVG